METTQAAPAMVAPPRRSRWRWWRIALVLGAIVVLAPLALLWYSNVATRHAWEAAEAEAALDLPRWRLMELEEDRAKVPDAENSALFMIALRRKAGGFSVSSSPAYEKMFEKLPPTARLNEQQSKFVRGELAKIPGPLADARKLKDMPRGRFPIAFTDDFISTMLPDHQNARQIAEWLQHDAMLLAHDGKHDQAIESCHAILNAGRAFDGDPFVIALLIRLAMQQIAMTSMERVLAQGQASEPALRDIQTVLEKEAKESSWLAAVRGERAGYHHLFDNIRQGKVEATWLSKIGVARGAGGGPDLMESIFLWIGDKHPSTLLKFYPEFLAYMNRTVEVAKLPEPERVTEMEKLQKEIHPTRNPVLRMLAPAMVKVSQAEVRCQAMLRASAVAVACERYRLKHDKGAWPATLDDVVKARLLDAVPVDPFDGQPIHYVRTKDGIVVYSIGHDLTDSKGNIDRDRVFEPGVDVGFRLWHVGRRRQAPLPPVVP